MLLIDANAAKIGEKISLQVWDNDRFTADDMLGHVEIDVSGKLLLTHIYTPLYFVLCTLSDY